MLIAAVVTGLVAVIFIATRVFDGDDGGIKRKRLAKGLDGPVVVLDPDGARYTLPKDWTISDVTKSGSQRYTAINGTGAIVRIGATSGRMEKPADVARDAGGVACGPEKQESVTFGGVDAVRCRIIPVGRVAKPGDETIVYYANASRTSWIIRVEGVGTRPPGGADLQQFLNSVRLGG